MAPATARTFLADMLELRQLDRRWIASLAGGGGKICAVLLMTALVAGPHKPVLKAFRDCLVAFGKSGIVATMRKLQTIFIAIIRAEKPWQAA